jgi:hypothetical protein
MLLAGADRWGAVGRDKLALNTTVTDEGGHDMSGCRLGQSQQVMRTSGSEPDRGETV